VLLFDRFVACGTQEPSQFGLLRIVERDQKIIVGPLQLLTDQEDPVPSIQSQADTNGPAVVRVRPPLDQPGRYQPVQDADKGVGIEPAPFAQFPSGDPCPLAPKSR